MRAAEACQTTAALNLFADLSRAYLRPISGEELQNTHASLLAMTQLCLEEPLPNMLKIMVALHDLNHEVREHELGECLSLPSRRFLDPVATMPDSTGGSALYAIGEYFQYLCETVCLRFRTP